MNTPIRCCSQCGQSFWSVQTEECDEVCPVCQPAPAEPVAPVEEPMSFGERPRFISLSALPPEKRTPGRTENQRILKVPRSLQESGSVPPPPDQASPPALMPKEMMPDLRQLGFNCPSCYTILIIKDPQNYDGRAAPCPYCGVNIVAPRVAPPTPFTLIAMPSEANSGLPPVVRPTHWRPFGKNKELVSVEVSSN
ncbi:MAG TPA: hypothetical protein VG796_12110 [Verrucomicrobiales bacterium]|nr:hypothetical protein [Verrucomicrobiales bacterium]